ncbi:MAG: DUF4347 domain-containing protein, partial [Okeania sp. SIO3H1]|nr:DUF4347 domain-containing protein [Okeania sp. SIO3H1]
MNFLTPNYNQDILDKKFTNNSHCVSIWPPGMGMLVIIDPTVENYQMLASGVLPGAKVVILNSEEDEVRQITRAILDYPVNSLHIICHGSPGSLQLGNIKFSFSNLGEYGAELKRWGEVIGTGGIFLYGCEVAAGDIGRAFVGRLHELTGVGVAGAVGPVGCAELGGSWELGVKVGNVGDGLAFGEEVLVGYGGIFADIVVNRQDDVIDPEDGLTSLREAIIEATSNGDIEDTITLSPGTYTLTIQVANEDLAGTGDLDIFAGGGGEIGFESASINIIGDSADTTIIDAQGLGDRVFDIIGLGVSVNISNVTIQNGSPVDGDGGGIRNRGGDVVLNNTVISNNSSTRIGEGGGQGGGISNNSGNLTINNSNISGNLAPSSNFSLGVGGGISNDANLTINNSTISGNTSGFSGGGIDNNGTATVTSSTIFNNNANDGGGFHNSGTAAISNSTISANLGENFGGGIWNDNTLEVNNSTITQNIADHAQNEVGNGGGIANGGTANINNTIIAGNFDNSSTTVEPDVSGNDTLVGAFNSNGSNLIGDIIGSSGFNPDEILPDTIDINSVVIEPNLANNNGSPTQTHALIQDANNPAIDGGNNDNADAANLTTDQSGSQRIVDGDGNGTEVVDIGAFEASQITLPIVSITATDAVATEGGNDPGQFAVNIDSPQNNDITVNYEINGTATNGIDYQALTGTVVIPGGQTSAVIDVVVTTDETIELAETVDISLQPSLNNNYTLGEINTASVTINETLPVTLPIVSITATDAVATEGGNDPGQFAVNIDSPQNNDITVNYEINGTATNGIDYQALTGTVVIPGGQTSAVIDVVVTTDETIELAETVDISLQPSLNNNYTLGEINTASVTINEVPIEEGSISGTKFNDFNNDGIFDSDELRIPGVTIYLDLDGDGELDLDEPSQITDNNGNYSFNNLAPGEYTVREVVPSGFTPTLTPPPVTITSIGEDFTNINFGNTANFPGISITQTDGNTNVTEGLTPDTYQIVLDSIPNDPVDIAIAPDNQIDLGAGPGIPITRSFDSTNALTPQIINVTAVDDAFAEGPHPGNITHSSTSNDPNYNTPTVAFTVDGTLSNLVTANITDNDTAAVSIQPLTTDATEGGATGSYEVVLTTQPTAPVTINFETGNQIQSINSITFNDANWNIPQQISVTALDDLIVENNHIGTISHQVISVDENYNAVQASQVTVDITDNDTAAVSITPQETTATEDGGLGNYQIVLTTVPTADVTINLVPDNQVQTFPASINFTPENWNIPQPITVSAIDDDIVEGEQHLGRITHQAISDDLNYNNLLEISQVTVDITDNDVPLAIPGSISGTKFNDINANEVVDPGESGIPGVTIYLDLDNDEVFDPNEPSQITDSLGNYSFNNLSPNTYFVREVVPPGFIPTLTPGQVIIPPQGEDLTNINFGNTAANAPGISITQTGESTDVIEGLTTDTYQIELDSDPSDQVNISITSEGQVLLSDNNNQIPSNTINLTFNPGNLGPQTITVTAVDDNIAGGDSIDNIIHTATSNDQNYNGPTAPFTVDGTPSNVIAANIRDDEVPNVVITPTTTDATEGGATGSYQVFLTTEPIGDVAINFNTDQQIQAIEPITFDQTNWNVPQTVTVEAVEDNIPETETQNIGTIAHQVSSQSDLSYNNLNISQVTVNIDDPEPTQVIITETDGNTTFTPGGFDNYTIQLNSNPTTPIEIAINPPLEINLGSGPGVPITREFNESNGTTPQNVTVT